MAEVQGTIGNDTLNGTSDGDVIHGYHGDDVINGGDGNDVIYGGGSLQQLDTNGVVATNETTAHIQLDSIAKGFHNSVGMYKISSDGSIHSVDVLFSPDGGKGGGQAINPNTSVDVNLGAGEQLGFFVLGNGYGTGKNADLLNDPNAKWELRTADGDQGLIVDQDLQLWHIDAVSGKETKMAKGKGHEIFHSVGTAEGGYAPNPDGVPHAVATVDTATGTVTLGLEAQKNGGNLSFDDAIIKIELGATNIEGLDDALIPLAGTDNDIINAGYGDDTVFGQAGNDRIDGEDGDDRLFGGEGDDHVIGGLGNDLISGGRGNDTLEGGAGADNVQGNSGDDGIVGGVGDDVLSGGGARLVVADNGAVVAHSTLARVTFVSEGAGYKSSVGSYKIGPDGAIHDVQIIFANASAVGSGGDLVPGETNVEFNVAKGDNLGFFILPDGFNSGGNAALFADATSHYEFRNSAGQPANINGGEPLTLVHIDDETGVETVIVSKYQNNSFHSIGSTGETYGLNSDGIKHAVVNADYKDDSFTVAFEDLLGGGDNDFDDVVLTVQFANAIPSGTQNNDEEPSTTDSDTISGGDGDDVIFGGKDSDDLTGDVGDDIIKGDSGDDEISGGEGDDSIKGGTDNDDVHGGAGDDDISGGKGTDVIYGEAGNDIIFGDTGDDFVSGGDGDDNVKGGEDNDEVYGDAGNDIITGGKGNDKLDGGIGNDDIDADSGDDTIIANLGDDSYNGGSGIDWIDFSAATGSVDVNLHTHVATSDLGTDEVWSLENVIGSAQADILAGDKRDNHLIGGDGDDWLSGDRGNDTLEGGDGIDTYSWTRKSVTGIDGTDSFLDIIIGFGSEDILDLSALTEIATDQTTTDVVQLSEASGDTTVSALNADSGLWVGVAVLTDVTGLTVESLDTGGQLIV